MQNSDKEMRQVLCDTLIELAKTDPRLVVLDADLASSSGLAKFGAAHPGRFVNCGIQEANMVGVAAGLAAGGFVPFLHSFAAFAGRRVLDQFFLSCAYTRLDVRLIGSDPGIMASANGGTHMALEDIAVMRAIPGVTVIEASDPAMLASIVEESLSRPGPYYLRLVRKTKQRFYPEDTRFAIGRAITAREGKDVAIVACGQLCLGEALQAAEMLQAEGVDATVLDMFTVKPLDEKALLDAAARHRALISVENHNVIGGIGSALAETLSENRIGIPFRRLGVREAFGEVGTVECLRGKYGMSAADIRRTAMELLQ